jgi:hypothetical protein
MRRVRIYVEGGGDGALNRAALRNGFRSFFERGVARFEIIACGRRDATFKRWKAALSSEPEAFNVLLVDSEGSVADGTAPRRHLGDRDGWQFPSGFDEQVHMMVQMMESWFLADPRALTEYYRHQFGANALPVRQNVEEIPKVEVERALKNATRKTSKGEYHKIHHGSALLALIDPKEVRKRTAHCERLLTSLASAQT